MFVKTFAILILGVATVLASPFEFSIPAEKDITANKTLALAGDVKSYLEQFISSQINSFSSAFEEVKKGHKTIEDVTKEVNSKLQNDIAKLADHVKQRVEVDKKFFEQKLQEGLKNINDKTEEFKNKYEKELKDWIKQQEEFFTKSSKQ